jgi:hypothetical protein
MADADDIRARLLGKRSRVPANEDLLSSGSTLLNLACSGRPDGAFKKGGYYFFVGDSSSGKSFITRTMFAEACLDPKFKGYDLIDDDVENGATMDFEAFFGKKMKDRVDRSHASKNLEDFYDHILSRKKPFVYLLDSMDALKPAVELTKMEESRKARAKGKEAKGSYGMDKAKINSNYMSQVNIKLKETGSILVLIGQTRDNVGLDAMFNPKTRGGGNALTFYAQLELWTSIRERLKKKALGKDRRTGIVAKVHVKKNRQTGRDRTVELPLYYASGLADVDANVRFLIAEGHWKASDGKVNAPEFDLNCPVDDLVSSIESADSEDVLVELVEAVWNNIDSETAVVRKSKYV